MLGADAVQPAPDADAELVSRTLRGELDAFERLVDLHRTTALRAAARIVGEHEAEDVTQDALLRAFHRLPSFRGDSPFRAWLLRIVRNTALNALARRRPEPVPEVTEEHAHERPARLTPADELEVSERRARLRSKLREIRPQHRAVLVLRELEGLSYEEIAALTGTPLGSVKTRIHRGRGELIELLRNNSYDWELPE